VSITIIGNELNILKAKEKILGIVKKHEHQQFSPHSFNKGDRAISVSTSTNASELSEDFFEYQVSSLEKKSTSQPMKKGNSLSRTSSSEDSFTLSSKSLDSDQMTLSRSPSFLQAEQEALIPSFLLGNDSDETMSSSGILFFPPIVKDDENTSIHRHNLSPNRQKDVITSLITIQDEHSRLYSYVNRD
jgi:hypothetical protein